VGPRADLDTVSIYIYEYLNNSFVNVILLFH
jgi:hypothetical protein